MIYAVCSQKLGFTYLAVEDVIWRVFLELEVPHEHHTVRVVGDVGVGEVAHQQQLRVLWVRCALIGATT